MQHVNYFAVAVAALSAFLLGGLWYSPVMFLKIWLKAAGIKKQADAHGPKVFIGAYVLSFIAALGTAYFLKPEMVVSETVRVSLIFGLCFGATSIGINFLFSGRKMTLLMIDAGYHIAQFGLYGLVLGLWPR